MEVFFAEPEHISGNQITLDEFESRHIVHTLKKKKGDKIQVTDGRGNLYFSEIIDSAKQVKVEFQNKDNIERKCPEVTLAVGFIRPNRLDTLIEKCTELGVRRFILFRSQFANYVSFNKSRFNKILRQAIKQSLQYYLPEIEIIEKFDVFIDKSVTFDARIVAHDPNDPGMLTALNGSDLSTHGSVMFAVGPEGGFSGDEIEKFKKSSFKIVSLGNTRLRTETAAINGVSVLQSYLQYKKETNIGNR